MTLPMEDSNLYLTNGLCFGKSFPDEVLFDSVLIDCTRRGLIHVIIDIWIAKGWARYWVEHSMR